MKPGGVCHQVNFHGGPVIPNAKIENVFWGSYWSTPAGAAVRAQVDQAWQTLGNNRAFYTPLAQYNTGAGRFLGSFQSNIDPPQQVYDSSVQDILQLFLHNYLVPTNDLDTLYVVYLPPGTTSHPDVDQNPQWGGHHSSFQSPTNGFVYYATITGLSGIDNLTLIASHEVDEAIADPMPGYAQGWDEVGDPCQNLTPRGYRLDGYWVERVYSDADCGCVTTLAAPFASKHDIVWQNTSNGWISFWQLNGGASIHRTADLASGGSNQLIGTGDFDGDGEGDLLWVDSATGNLTTWLINGTQIKPVSGPTLPAVLYSTVQGTGDFDGDGITDVVWRNYFDGGVRIEYGGARWTGPTSPVLGAGTDWTIQGVGDFNGDRRADILWRQTGSGAISIWFGAGNDQSGGPVIAASVTPDWQIAGVGDFNGDGRSDILWRNTARGDVGEWVMNGATVTTATTVWAGVSSVWQINAVGDLDGDGKADIVWRQTQTGEVGSWLMNGTAVRSMPSLHPGVPGQWQIRGTSADQTF